MRPEAFILVGGRSSRFEGGEKPSARIGSKTLAERAVETVRSALPGSNIYFVTRDTSQFIAESGRLGVDVISDRVEGSGPVGGLFTALAECKSEWLFLFACDMPLMSPALIAAMWLECDPSYGAVLPRQTDGRLQPLCAFFRVAEAMPVVEALIHRPGGSASMMEAIDSLAAKIVESAELGAKPIVWANVNTTEELDEIGRKLSSDKKI